MRTMLKFVCLISFLFFYSCKKENNDYRNAFIGLYKCEVNVCWATYDSGGIFHNHYNAYQDTIEVSKHSNANMLKISNIPDVYLDPNNSTFYGYHTSGVFKNDSIEIYYFLTPAALTNYKYKGKKLNK